MTGPETDDGTATVPLDLPGALEATGGGRVLSALLRPRAEGVRLTAGMDLGDGSWSLTPNDLTSTALVVKPGTPPFFVDLEATVGGEGEEPSVFDLILRVSPPGAKTSRGSGLAVPLNLTATEDGRPLILAGLSDGASLSAGVDNGDGSWSVKSSEVASLRLYPPPDFSGRMALTVTPAGAGPEEALPVIVDITAPGRPEPAPAKQPKDKALNLTARLVPIQGRRPTRLEARGVGADLEAAIPDMTTAEAELGRLRDAIGALRDELEATDTSVEETVKAAIAAAEEKLAGLKAEAGDRRDRMEAIRDAQQGAIDDVLAAKADEIKRLKADAQERRDTLEEVRDARAGAIDTAVGDARNTIAALKETVGKLRDNVETTVSGYREKEEALRSQAEAEAKDLQAAIVDLRDRLESVTG